jgi:hypothetical protein
MSKTKTAEKKVVAVSKTTNPVAAPPAGDKKCPICGRVNDAGNPTCFLPKSAIKPGSGWIFYAQV